MLVHHILPIRRASYPTILDMIRRDVLTAIPDARLQHDALNGTLYATPLNLPLEARSDSQLQAGSDYLLVDVHRLPVAEYRAVACSSSNYAQPEYLAAILPSIEQIGHNFELQPRIHQPTLVLPREWPFTAQWITYRWSCLKRSNEWFVVLWFDLDYVGGYNKTLTSEVALDLGANPLVSLADDNGLLVDDLSQRRIIIPAPWQDYLSRSPQLKERIEFEVLRQDLTNFTQSLIMFAATVYLENLSYTKMNRPFVQWARRVGLIDWHEAWLPARLAAAAIPMEKVDPAGTSQRCCCCQYPYGQRRNDEFHCPNCGANMNAHCNAAHNILLRGQEKARSWQAAHAKTRGRSK